MTHRFYHFFPPLIETVKNSEQFRDMLWMDSEEIAQRDQLDRKIVEFALNLELIKDSTGKLVRNEFSLSEAESLVLTTNYRYALKADEMEDFFRSTPKVTDLYLDFHQRIGIGFSPTLIDKLITRIYTTLTIAPTESNIKGEVGHAQYPHFWIYPYVKYRLHEILSVGIPGR